MPNGFGYLYCTTRSSSELFSAMEQILLSIGLQVESPGTNLVQMWDDMGNYERVSREQLLHELTESNHSSFQWWWNECDDLFCTMRRLRNFSVCEFALDGIDTLQTLSFMKCMFELLNSPLAQSVIGFVFTRHDDYALEEQRDFDLFFTDEEKSIDQFINAVRLPIQDRFLFNESAKFHVDTKHLRSIIVAKKCANGFQVVVCGSQ